MKPELKEGIDYYLTPEGFLVFTEKYHQDRGYCCGMGCRHCPYQYENVPEPRKSALLSERAQDSNHRSTAP
ncbi:MAG TPA: DUF5522 domain-containing protein [Chitinophagaceae bacterium]|nr:DUF5522 domain-containing protein [Chitinophagaceae bacterium]